MTQTAPYGTWRSPISVAALIEGAVGIGDVIPEPDALWWSESRPDEGGRTAIMCRKDDQTTEITPPDTNVRTLVHEYGGGAWWVADGVCYYVDFNDQRLRSIKPGGEPRLLSPEPDSPRSQRYADFRLTADGQWLVAVSELKPADGTEAVNSLVAIATDGSMRSVTLVSGADFYQSPCLAADASRLAWVQWQHPNMPWDDTELHVADLMLSDKDISLKESRRVAGGGAESIVQPSWSPDNRLHFLSDRNDRWQLYQEGIEKPVVDVPGETGLPPWVFGLSTYAFTSSGDVVTSRIESGVGYLDGYPQYSSFRSIRTAGDNLSFAAAAWDRETAVVNNGVEVVPPRDTRISQAFFSPAEPIEFPTADGDTAHALYFAPQNPDFAAASDEKPPLIVLAHGGPTSAARSELSLARHFWTSRGFAVVDVNYRGSSGFGRAYRKKLEGNWGVADVEDCASAARYLVTRGDVDPQRLIIRGGSAGGYTVLCALAFHDTFTAGANMYGVADLEALAAETHKFESRYLEKLVGPYPAEKARYQARSPIHHLERFTAPMIVLQGSEDAIVPPNQSRMIVDALDERNIPVAYIEFEGEQHGFRKAESIRHALLAELAFYGRIFGFEPEGESIEVDIRNYPV